MNNRITIFLCLGLLFMVSCSEDKAETAGTLQLELNPQPVFSFNGNASAELYGTWGYSVLFYDSELKIEKNGTFEFYSEGCYGRSITKGHWSLYGQQLLLNSHKEYKNIVAPEEQVVYTTEPLKKSRHTRKGAQMKFTYINVDYTATIKPPSLFDTAYLYFDQERFVFNDGFLYSNNISENKPYKKIKSML